MYIQITVLAVFVAACLAAAVPGQAMGRPDGSVPAPLAVEGIRGSDF